MFKCLKRCFVPTRFDAYVLAIVIHWLVAVLLVIVMSTFIQSIVSFEADAIICSTGATWLAIAATIGWRANSKRRMVLLFASSIMSLGFAAGWFYFNAEEIVAQLESSGRQYSHQELFDVNQFVYDGCWHLSYCVAASFVLWGLNGIARAAFSRVRSHFFKLGQIFKNDRTKALFVVAGVLFFIAMVSRIASSLTGIDVPDSVGVAIRTGLSTIGIFLFWAVCLFWFPRCTVLKGKPIRKLTSLVMASFFFVPIAVNASRSNDAFLNIASLWLVGGVVFMLSAIGIGGESSKSAMVSDQLGSEGSGNALGVSRPTLVSFVCVFLLLASIVTPWFVDLAVFTLPQRGNIPAWQQLELAVESARVLRQSDGAITLHYDNRNQVMTWKVQFSATANSQLLETLPEKGTYKSIELVGLMPSFDLNALRESNAGMKLTDCKVSHSQLNDALGSASWLVIGGNFSALDDGVEVDLDTLGAIEFRDTNPGAIADFFEASKSEKQMKRLILNTLIGNKDWPAIEGVAQFAEVYLYGGWMHDFEMPKTHRSLKKIHRYVYAELGKSWAIDKDLLLNTEIDFSFGGRLVDSAEDAWKLLILRGYGEFASHVSYIELPEESFAERAKEIGMAYQLHDDKSVMSLYFPWGERERFTLRNLKILSYDPSWVGYDSMRIQSDPVSLDHIRSHVNLEQLYFPPMFVLKDLAFLRELTSLKHLQIPSVVRRVTGPVGFDACQSLESITFLGTPDGQTFREIAKLKNLTRLVIVNFDEDETLTLEYGDKLSQKLPGVDVQILMPTETEKLVPEPFRKYRDRTRDELMADVTWVETLLTPNE